MASSIISRQFTDSGLTKYAVKDVPAEGSVLITHNGSLLLFTDRGGLWSEGIANRPLTALVENTRLTVSRVSAQQLRVASSYTYGTAVIAFCTGDVSITVE